jgi:uncharacterized repeat protein (TIGR01451 family)
MFVTQIRAASSLAFFLALAFFSSLAHADHDVRVLHYETATLDFKSAQPQAANKTNHNQTTLRFAAFGKSFIANLEPNTRVTIPPGSHAQPLRGVLDGHENSWVRITRNGDVVHGLMFDGVELLAIEPAKEIAADAREGIAVFRLADTQTDLGADFCSTNDAPLQNGLQMYQGLGADSKRILAQVQSSGARMRLELSALTDAAFRSRFADDAAANDAVVARINNVDGIYSGQLGIEIAVTQIAPMAEDAGSATTNPDSLLQSVSRARSGSANLYSTGITHLFTGTDLDGSTVGIAYINTICSSQYSVSLGEARDRGVWFDSLVAAHEIGHSFGSPHDGSGQCATTSATAFLMAPVINGSDRFSQCSLDIMQTRVQTASCLVPIPLADISIPSDIGSYHAAQNQAFTFTMTISNIGNADSTNSRVQLTVPAALNVTAATSGADACSIGGGTVACDLGTVSAHESRTVQLTLIGAQRGTYSINAALSANSDLDSGNDAGTATIRVDPAFDLGIAMTAPDTTVPDQPFTATISVVNKTGSTAPSLDVWIAMPTGMALSGTAQFDGVPCESQYQTVHCNSSALAANRTITATLTMIAHDVGSQIITATLDGAYIDSQPQDNIAQRSIVVGSGLTTATANTQTMTDKSGGGALSGFWLSLLAYLFARRLHYSRQAGGK